MENIFFVYVRFVFSYCLFKKVLLFLCLYHCYLHFMFRKTLLQNNSLSGATHVGQAKHLRSWPAVQQFAFLSLNL